jgi:hypothetical protein
MSRPRSARPISPAGVPLFDPLGQKLKSDWGMGFYILNRVACFCPDFIGA